MGIFCASPELPLDAAGDLGVGEPQGSRPPHRPAHHARQEVGPLGGRRRPSRRDPGARPAPGDQEAGGLQLLVGAGHGAGGDVQVAGQLSDRGEPLTAGQGPGDDELGDPGADLLEGRNGGGGVEADEAVHAGPSDGVVSAADGRGDENTEGRRMSRRTPVAMHVRATITARPPSAPRR